MELHAWIDESARVANAEPPAYFLGGVAAAPGASEAHRDALRPLQNTRRKLHWRDTRMRSNSSASSSEQREGRVPSKGGGPGFYFHIPQRGRADSCYTEPRAPRGTRGAVVRAAG